MEPDTARQAAEAAPTGNAKNPRLSPRARFILITLALLAVAAAIGWFAYYQLRGQYLESTDDAFMQADAVTVAPKVSGYVQEVFVGDNQDVKVGQALVRIDARDFHAQTAQFQAQIDVSKANADNVRAAVREQEASIVQARAQLASADEDARFAAAQVARYTPLASTGAETREQLAALRNQAAQAAEKARAQQAALQMAERRVGSLQAQIRQAEAQGEVAEAQRAAADVNLDATVVKASVDGRVGDKSVRVGQFVQAGTRMLSVVPLATLYVSANYKETQIGLMRAGQPVSIKVDALPDVKLRGHVDSVAPGTGAQFSLLPPQNATGNFTKIVQRVPVRIALDAGPDVRKVLVPGLSVTVTVDTQDAKGDLKRIREQQSQKTAAAASAFGATQ